MSRPQRSPQIRRGSGYDMKVLERQLPPPFDQFWERFHTEIPVAVEQIETGHSVVFGDQGYDLSAPNDPAWAGLPDDDLAYHVAHELFHIVQRQRGYPKTVRGRHYPPGSVEERIGGDLEEMILHPPLEELLRGEMGFENDFIRQRLLQGAQNGVANSPVPEYGTPWFTTWAIRYCELHFTLTANEWAALDAVFRERTPQVARLGEEMMAIMREVGWGTREQALEALVGVRDSLGLQVNQIVLVMDPITGEIF